MENEKPLFVFKTLKTILHLVFISDMIDHQISFKKKIQDRNNTLTVLQ